MSRRLNAQSRASVRKVTATAEENNNVRLRIKLPRPTSMAAVVPHTTTAAASKKVSLLPPLNRPKKKKKKLPSLEEAGVNTLNSDML